jgi:CubicO group peptidase (beta-lactamase class C family)
MAPAGPLLPPPPPTPPAPVPSPDPGSIELPTLTPTVQTLTPRNLAVSVSVWRDRRKVYGAAAGADALGSPVTTETPFVLASVSKLVTMLTVVRLAQAGLIALDAPTPWEAMGVPRHPWWDDVTVRELMWHTAGMRVAQNSWLNQPGPCAVPLSEAMVEPPREWRGRWVYSNGNYCALGMLIEHVTSQPIDAAARTWLFDGIGVTGPHLTSDGLVLGDGPYALDVRRLDRLGGAGTWMGSTDDIAALLSAVTDDDRAMLTLPAVMVDQYGWGHTGSVDGARACSWVMEGGRTVLSAVVSGNRPSSGGRLCDALIPALAHDLGLYAGPPVRLPD